MRNRYGLTPRESEILTAVLGGLTNRQIAARHGIGQQTVKNYLTTIYEKVGVSNRIELIDGLTARRIA